MPRARPIDVCAAAGALAGVLLALNAWTSGSLFRYQLAGFVAAVALALPLLTIVLWRDRARRVWRRVGFVCVPLVVLLLLAELAWRAFGPAYVPPEVLRADPRLGHVFVEGSGGTDARGFRNTTTAARTDVLCVGDSQTWGFLVEPDDTFTTKLGAELGLHACQMANGSYGPVQYRELVRQGLHLQPRLVVIGFYFGNDLIDAVDYAGLDGGEDLRAPGRTYRVRHNPELDGVSSPNWTMAAVDAVFAHSYVLGRAGAVVKAWLRGGVLDDQPGAVLFGDPSVPTILLPDYRLPTVDPASETVRDGVRITARCLHDIAADCRAAGARCVLLAIPTKEFAYAEWRRGVGAPLPGLEALHAAEAQVRATVFAAAHDAGCELVDLGPACVDSLARGVPPWAANGDGHILQHGHAIAARLLAEQWRRQ